MVIKKPSKLNVTHADLALQMKDLLFWKFYFQIQTNVAVSREDPERRRPIQDGA